jgi:hypothetical protein
MSHVKCQNCGTEYNGRTGKSNRTRILIYFLASFAIAFCVCGGIAIMSALLNRYMPAKSFFIVPCFGMGGRQNLNLLPAFPTRRPPSTPHRNQKEMPHDKR